MYMIDKVYEKHMKVQYMKVQYMKSTVYEKYIIYEKDKELYMTIYGKYKLQYMKSI